MKSSESRNQHRPPNTMPPGNSNRPDNASRMLLVVAAPSVDDDYRRHFAAFMRFYGDFARATCGRDNFIVLADAKTLPRLRPEIPEDQLLEADVADVWIRDFGTLHPRRMLQFQYDRPRERFIQKSLRGFAVREGLRFDKVELKADGGDTAIITEKVYARNPAVPPAQMRERLRSAPGLKHPAIMPVDDEYPGHADGMVLIRS